MSRKLYKTVETDRGKLTIRELTDDWQEIRYSHDIEALPYVIAENTEFYLDDFMRFNSSPRSLYFNEFDGYADDTNTSTLLIKIDRIYESARIFIAY